MKMRFVVLFLGLTVSALCGCGSSDAAGSGNDPASFVTLCQNGGLSCNADSDKNPPNLVGNYSGLGQTVETTNSLWSVGDMNSFDAAITRQSGGTLDGTFDMGSLHLDIKDGQIRGDAQSFTIFGTDVVSQDNCNVEAQAVIVGTAATGGVLTGNLALEFTKNISGSGCTQDQINGYPGTGAVFTYTAAMTPATSQ